MNTYEVIGFAVAVLMAIALSVFMLLFVRHIVGKA